MAFKKRTLNVEEFIKEPDTVESNPKAKRVKQLGIKVNDHEYALLEQAAERLNRTITDTMRYLIFKGIKDDLG